MIFEGLENISLDILSVTLKVRCLSGPDICDY